MKKITLSDIKQSSQLFRRFNKYILRYWKVELAILILGNFSIVLSLVTPYIGKIVLDNGILAKNMRVFIIFTILGIGIYIINLVMGNGHRYLQNYVIRKVRIDLARDVFKKINKYSLRLFQDRSTGGHIFRVTQGIAATSNIINSTLPNIITTIFKLILITAIIIFINWKILILIMIYQFLVLVQINLFIKRIEELMRAGLEKSEDIFKRLNEFFSHIYIIKAFGTMRREIRRYLHQLIERMRLEIRGTKLRIASDVLRNTSSKLFFGIIGFYGAFLVIKGEMSLGSLGAIMMYITQGMGAYTALLTLGQQIVLNRISLQRLTELLDADIDIEEKAGAKNIVFSGGKIEFRRVYFGYEQEKYVLNEMNFVIPPRSKIALVGPSGCGKTTALNLILRLYDVNEGAISLDDYDIRDIKFKSLYSQISLAPQQSLLWNDSVVNNILYGKEKASIDEVIYAAKIAQAHDFILNLPQGYETIIGENACRISQGQKQRIAIARAVIKKPKILILDEAMSSLDSETEDKIIDNIKGNFRDSTLIIVSHRLSSVRKMDLVYFLESPSNMQLGSHQEVIARSTKYKELFASQMGKIEEKIYLYDKGSTSKI